MSKLFQRPLHEDVTGRIAFMPGRDDFQERIWRNLGNIGEALLAAGYEAAVSPGFSTYDDRPPYDGLFEVRRTLEVAVELSRHLPTVPTVVWRSHKDLERWAKWLAASRVKVVGVHLSHRSKEGREWFLEGVQVLSGLFATHERPRLLAYGPSTADAIRRVRRAWDGKLTVASQSPWQKARSGRLLTASLRPQVAPEIPKELLPRLNWASYSSVARKLTGSNNN